MTGNWALRYGTTLIEFGDELSLYPFTAAPELGFVDLENEDARRPRADGMAFGRDFAGSQAVIFRMQVEQFAATATERQAACRAVVGALRAAWDAPEVRNTPGALAELVSNSGRVGYGRPRRFVSDDTFDYAGAADLLADFRLERAIWYGAPVTVVVPFAPVSRGGLVSPLVSPLTSTGAGERTDVLELAGERGSWAVFTIRGPITDPWIEVGGVRYALRGTFAADDVVTIDTRPWAMTVRRNGASIAGALTADSTPLDAASIPPGAHVVRFGGISNTATASLTIEARPAYTTP